MFPEETYLTRRCGRLRAGRAQLPVVAEEGGSLSDKMCMWEKTACSEWSYLTLPIISRRWLFTLDSGMMHE